MYKLFAGSLFFAAVAVAPLTLLETPAQAQVIRVEVAPPAPRLEVIPAAPSPRHVWLPGYWNWDARGRQHVWVAGRYEIGRPQLAWIPARWVQKWEYLPGHWGPASAAPIAVQPAPPPAQADEGPGNEELEVEVAPPPPQQEVIPVAPSPQHVWIGGFWQWDPMARRHVWITGRYELGRPGMHWMAPHWVQRGWRWRYMPGHWR